MVSHAGLAILHVRAYPCPSILDVASYISHRWIGLDRVASRDTTLGAMCIIRADLEISYRCLLAFDRFAQMTLFSHPGAKCVPSIFMSVYRMLDVVSNVKDRVSFTLRDKRSVFSLSDDDEGAISSLPIHVDFGDACLAFAKCVLDDTSISRRC